MGMRGKAWCFSLSHSITFRFHFWLHVRVRFSYIFLMFWHPFWLALGSFWDPWPLQYRPWCVSRCWDASWSPFASLWAPFGLPSAPFWFPFGSLWHDLALEWLPFGSLSLPFAPCGSLWASFCWQRASENSQINTREQGTQVKQCGRQQTRLRFAAVAGPRLCRTKNNNLHQVGIARSDFCFLGGKGTVTITNNI